MRHRYFVLTPYGVIKIKSLSYTVVDAFRDIVANTFSDFKTLTADNGSEFSMHKQLTEITGANVFFARPYHSWERGLNEHSNGLIRRFYPKGTDFNSVTDNEIPELEHILKLGDENRWAIFLQIQYF